MELNGLANIKATLIVERMEGTITEEAAKLIEEQCDLMEKYFVAYQFIPDLHWHEVREHAALFPRRADSKEAYADFLKVRS